MMYGCVRFFNGFKIAAWMVIVAFSWQQVGYAAGEMAQGQMMYSPILMPQTPSLEEIILDPSKMPIPFEHATLKEFHSGDNGKLIIHIQDAHANYSGQLNMANTLKYFMKQYDLSLVLSEGSARNSTLGDIKELATPSEWKVAAKRLLRDGVIKGEEYVNLTTNHPIEIRGVEYQDLYDKGLQAYSDLAGQREKLFLYMHAIHSSIQRLKHKHYSPVLLRYEASLREAEENSNPMERMRRLLRLAKQARIDLEADYPESLKLQKLQFQEQNINFSLVNDEQSKLINLLSNKSKEAGEKARSFVSTTKKNNYVQMMQHTFLNDLFTLTREYGMSVNAYPNLIKYQQYSKAFADLSVNNVLHEFDRLEDDVYKNLLHNSTALKIRAIDRYLGLLKKAYQIQMSSEEFEMLLDNEKDFPTMHWQGFINEELRRLRYIDDLVPFKPYFENTQEFVHDFYASVDERDYAFLENAERIMAEEKESVAFLIAGGYHTDHLTELLRNEGTSYLVLTPVITAATDHKKYETRLLSTLKSPQKRVASYKAVGAGNEKLANPAYDQLREVLVKGGGLASFLRYLKPWLSNKSIANLERHQWRDVGNLNRRRERIIADPSQQVIRAESRMTSLDLTFDDGSASRSTFLRHNNFADFDHETASLRYEIGDGTIHEYFFLVKNEMKNLLANKPIFRGSHEEFSALLTEGASGRHRFGQVRMTKRGRRNKRPDARQISLPLSGDVFESGNAEEPKLPAVEGEPLAGEEHDGELRDILPMHAEIRDEKLEVLNIRDLYSVVMQQVPVKYEDFESYIASEYRVGSDIYYFKYNKSENSFQVQLSLGVNAPVKSFAENKLDGYYEKQNYRYIVDALTKQVPSVAPQGIQGGLLYSTKGHSEGKQNLRDQAFDYLNAFLQIRQETTQDRTSDVYAVDDDADFDRFGSYPLSIQGFDDLGQDVRITYSSERGEESLLWKKRFASGGSLVNEMLGIKPILIRMWEGKALAVYIPTSYAAEANYIVYLELKMILVDVNGNERAINLNSDELNDVRDGLLKGKVIFRTRVLKMPGLEVPLERSTEPGQLPDGAEDEAMILNTILQDMFSMRNSFQNQSQPNSRAVNILIQDYQNVLEKFFEGIETRFGDPITHGNTVIQEKTLANVVGLKNEFIELKRYMEVYVQKLQRHLDIEAEKDYAELYRSNIRKHIKYVGNNIVTSQAIANQLNALQGNIVNRLKSTRMASVQEGDFQIIRDNHGRINRLASRIDISEEVGLRVHVEDYLKPIGSEAARLAYATQFVNSVKSLNHRVHVEFVAPEIILKQYGLSEYVMPSDVKHTLDVSMPTKERLKNIPQTAGWLPTHLDEEHMAIPWYAFMTLGAGLASWNEESEISDDIQALAHELIGYIATEDVSKKMTRKDFVLLHQVPEEAKVNPEKFLPRYRKLAAKAKKLSRQLLERFLMSSRMTDVMA